MSMLTKTKLAMMTLLVGFGLITGQLHQAPIQAQAAYGDQYIIDYSNEEAVMFGSISDSYTDIDYYTLKHEQVEIPILSIGTSTNAYAVAGTRFGGNDSETLRVSNLLNAPAAISSTYFYSYLRVNMKIPLPLAKVEITLLSNWEADTNDMAYVQTSPKADFSVTSELLAVAIVENTTLVFEPVTPFSQNNYMRIIFTKSTASEVASGVTVERITFFDGEPYVKTLTGIDITTEPSNKTYYEGDNFWRNDMVVTASFYDDVNHLVLPSEDVSENCQANPQVLQVGITSVTISYTYGGVTKTDELTGIVVNANAMVEISIQNPAAITTFSLGEKFTTTGLLLTVQKEHTQFYTPTGFTVNTIDTTVLGKKTVVINYEGKTTSYPIKVTNEGAKVGVNFFADELFISQYSHNSPNSLIIELYNPTESLVRLDGIYTIKIDTDGAGTWASELNLSGIITSKEAFVLANYNVDYFLRDMIDQYADFTFNGNDSVGLFKNDVLIDIIGVFGENPGTGWTVDGIANATLEHHLSRKAAVITPAAIWNTSEWIVGTWTKTEWGAYLDGAGGLGWHTTTLDNVNAYLQAVAFANYGLTGIGNLAGGNCEAVSEALGIEYNFMDSSAKNIYELNESQLFVDARARQNYLIVWTATPGGGGVIYTPTRQTLSKYMLLIATISISATLAYYLVKKKKAV